MWKAGMSARNEAQLLASTPLIRETTSSAVRDAIALDGRIVVVLDDADRENEGDLIMAAEHATPQALAFLVEHSSGFVCIGMTGAALDRLQLPLQARMPRRP